MKILIFILGVIAGGGVAILLLDNFDLLSSDKGKVVALKHDLTLVESESTKFTLPKGTRLKVKSNFDDVGEYYLGVVITDLSIVENSDGDSMYFPVNQQ